MESRLAALGQKRTVTDRTHLSLKGMVQRKYDRILNVSSTASFMPGPLQAV